MKKKTGRIEKIKEAYRKYKELKKDPRKKALMQLGAWLVGFLLFYIIAVLIMPHPNPYRSFSSSSNSNQDALSNYRMADNFEYTMSFQYSLKEDRVEGTYFDKKYYFTYLGKEYTSFDGKVYEVDTLNQTLKNTTDFIPLLASVELSKDSLLGWIDLSEKLEEKTYKDSKKVSQYQFQMIPLKVTEENHQITKIEIDLKAYLASRNLLYDSFLVTIEYQEINLLEDYQSHYEDYQIVEGEQNVTNQNGF